MDHMRKDGSLTYFQWQRLIGKSWSPVELPCSGDGYKAPLHADTWDQTAGGKCWQQWGFHGFMDEARAKAALPLVEAYCRTDHEGRWPVFRLARVEVSQLTTPLITVELGVQPKKAG